MAAARHHDGTGAQFRREGGRSLSNIASYQGPAPKPPGKTSDDTDTFEGRFAELVPCRRILQLIEFESEDPAFAGEMRMTVTLTDVGDGVAVGILCENIPPGIRPEDNEAGCRSSLSKLAVYLE